VLKSFWMISVIGFQEEQNEIYESPRFKKVVQMTYSSSNIMIV